MFEHVKDLLKAHEGLKHEVYLDIENSSMVPKEVVEAMLPYFSRYAYGNPTLTHKPGWEAFEAIMESSQKIAKFLGCKVIEEVNFAPGETEVNNLALMGAAFTMKDKGKKIVVSEIEPLSVLHVTDLLSKYGFTVVKIPVDGEGFI
ncbi:cysteine desulfurase, partial [Candidatus Bathyarchaeota archaeon]